MFGSAIAFTHGMSECSMLFEHDEPKPRLVELKIAALEIDHERRFAETRFLLGHFDPQQVRFGIASLVVRTQPENKRVEE